MNKIKFPDESFFNKLIEKAKDTKEKINNLWDECKNGNMDCDEVHYLVEEIESETIYLLSLFSITKEVFDKNFNRGENEQYDVSKIFISENSYKKMKEYDKKIIEIVYGDFLSNEGIEKEVNWIYFMSGFSISDNVSDNEIAFAENFLRKMD